MSEKVIATCRYRHPEIGLILVKVNAAAKSLSARWEGPELHITVPRNCPVDIYDDFLRLNSSRIIALRPKPRFAPGVIDGNVADFEIIIADNLGNSLGTYHIESQNAQRGKEANGIIRLNAAIVNREGIDSDYVQTAINDMLSTLAWRLTGLYLLPHARELAAKVGHCPQLWEVKHSKTRLGWCSSKGTITLSPRLIFMPQELADFIIYHELAHLSEMSHSSAFHRLCNDYCGGREAELSAAVKSFRFPIY